MHESTKINQQGIEWVLNQPINSQLSIIANHMEICRIVLQSLLTKQANIISGEKYCRIKSPEQDQYRRYGYNPGSIRIGNQKLPVQVPRIENLLNGEKGNIPFYNELKHLPEQKTEMVLSILKGISLRDYHDVATKLQDSLGLSKSSLSNHFIEYSKDIIETFQNRTIEEEYVALFIDGKYLEKEQMIVTLGVTKQGYKRVLSVIQTHGEGKIPIANMLEELLERKLKIDDGILVVIDGSKGLRSGVETVFKEKAIIQRCQFHKQENVLSYLKEEQQIIVKKEIQEAYNTNNYEQAKDKLETIANKLEKINVQASRSMKEGLEETLAIHKLGLAQELRRSFMTTNVIESLNSSIGKYTKKVKNWMNSNQRYRWTILACNEAEKTFKRVSGYKCLHLLSDQLKRKTNLNENHTPNDIKIKR